MTKINITPIIILIIIDIFNLNTLWNERYDRRLLHHIQNNNYNMKKVPILFKINNMLTNEQISNILNLKFADINGVNTINKFISKLVGGQYSKRSSLYFNSFDKKIQKELESIALSIKPRLESICGKKLQLGNSDFKCILLRYEGKDSNFGWHYDTEPSNCYRTLILIKSEGIISPFMYKDENGSNKKIILTIGNGILFKGTQTYHKVGPSNDPNTVRWMLGFQFITESYPKKCRSLCSELRGASLNNYLKIFIPRVILTFMIIKISKLILPIYNLNLYIYIIISSSIIIMSYFLPKYIKNRGTGIISTHYSIFSYFFLLNIHHFDPILSIGYLAYILITEMLLPTEIISKNLNNGGS